MQDDSKHSLRPLLLFGCFYGAFVACLSVPVALFVGPPLLIGTVAHGALALFCIGRLRRTRKHD